MPEGSQSPRPAIQEGQTRAGPLGAFGDKPSPNLSQRERNRKEDVLNRNKRETKMASFEWESWPPLATSPHLTSQRERNLKAKMATLAGNSWASLLEGREGRAEQKRGRDEDGQLWVGILAAFGDRPSPNLPEGEEPESEDGHAGGECWGKLGVMAEEKWSPAGRKESVEGLAPMQDCLSSYSLSTPDKEKYRVPC